MVTILDTTLREGELQPGVYFSRESRTKIAEALAKVGTPRIELPLVYTQRGGKIEDIKDTVTAIQENYGKTAILQFRAYKPDVELSQGYDAKGCALYMAPTNLHRIGKLHGLNQQRVIDIFIETLELAKYNRRMSMGDRIALQIKRAKEKRILEQKVTRCSPAFIKMYMCCSRYLHRLSAIEFLQLIVKAGFFPCIAYVSFLFNEEVFQLPGLTTCSYGYL